MNAQNAFAPAHIGPCHDYAPVETARPQQRRIENIGAIGGRHQNDAFISVETVHLHQQLVQRLLALVVSAAEACAAVTSYGVNLVNEDDAGSGLFTLLEQITDAARADADEHLDEVRAGDREERNVRLACHGPCQ